jgi:hypothetical protein
MDHRRIPTAEPLTFIIDCMLCDMFINSGYPTMIHGLTLATLALLAIGIIIMHLVFCMDVNILLHDCTSLFTFCYLYDILLHVQHYFLQQHALNPLFKHH